MLCYKHVKFTLNVAYLQGVKVVPLERYKAFFSIGDAEIEITSDHNNIPTIERNGTNRDEKKCAKGYLPHQAQIYRSQ